MSVRVVMTEGVNEAELDVLRRESANCESNASASMVWNASIPSCNNCLLIDSL